MVPDRERRDGYDPDRRDAILIRIRDGGRGPAAGEALAGRTSPRMRILTADRKYDFVFHGGLDDRIDAVETGRTAWRNRERFAS